MILIFKPVNLQLSPDADGNFVQQKLSHSIKIHSKNKDGKDAFNVKMYYLWVSVIQYRPVPE